MEETAEDIEDSMDINNIISPHPQINIKTIITWLQGLATLLKKSPQKNEGFLRIVAAMRDGKELGLVSDVSTWWNSTFHMLRRALELQEAVGVFCPKDCSTAKFNLTGAEWEKVQKLCYFLEPLDKATQEISYDKQCTMVTAAPTYS